MVRMRNYLLKLSIAAIGLLSFLTLSPAIIYAADCDNPATTADAIACGANDSAGVPVGKDPTKSLDQTITNVINLLSVAVGVIAVIMLIVGGLRYITSSGNAEKTKSARNTILYAAIGLVVVALSQVIAKFVLHAASR